MLQNNTQKACSACSTEGQPPEGRRYSTSERQAQQTTGNREPFTFQLLNSHRHVTNREKE
jgi:hypothetical protein